MKRIFLICLVLLVSSINLYSQVFTQEELQILRYQDERTFGKNNELFTYLDNRNDAVVTRALWAIGNIGNKDGIKVVAEKLFSGHSEEIRLAAAYSLGLLPFDESRKVLIEALNTEKNSGILCEIINSLGYIGDKDNYEEIVSYKTTSEELRTYLAVSIARFARRNIKSEKGVEKLIELSSGKDERTLRLVSYALSNMRSKELLAPAKTLITGLLKSNEHDTRMWSYLANGYVAGPDEVKSIMNAYDVETVWQVKVNMLNSLQAINRFNPDLSENSELAQFLVNKGQGEDVYLGTTALKVLGNVFKSTKNETLKKDLLPQLEWFMTKGKAVDIPVIADAVIAMGMIYKDKARDELIAYYNDVEGYELKEAVISSFKYFDDAAIAGTMRDMITKDVQAYVNKNKIESGEMIAGKELNGLYRAYVETLGELKYKANEKDRTTFRLIFSEFISSKDPSIIDLCITSLSDSIFIDKRSETLTILALDYQDLVYPKDKESMRLFIRAMGNLEAANTVDLLKKELQSSDYEIAKESADALKKITGKDYTFTAMKKYITNIEDINSLDKKSFAIFKTNQGNIKIRLYPYYAPFSVLNFVNLAEKGFFNNTVFHRVIPNFVIQGGDPLNNGWGGPEYSIRSEFAPLHYERGVFGMASDGKDTEGSQFFITHSPFYHLDNAYTIFGEVTDGMDVADVIYIGDVLEKVTIVSQ